MRVLRDVKGVTLRDWIKSDDGNATDVARWVRSRRRNWRDHVDRMGQDRCASWAPTDPQELARWVRTRRRNWKDHVDRMGQDWRTSWAPTDPQELARWVRTRRRNWKDHVDRMGQNRWASWAPTDPQEDHLKYGERAVRQRQKRTDTDKQQNRVIKKKKNRFRASRCGTTPPSEFFHIRDLLPFFNEIRRCIVSAVTTASKKVNAGSYLFLRTIERRIPIWSDCSHNSSNTFCAILRISLVLTFSRNINAILQSFQTTRCHICENH
jgi:hypothetical protein